jgi:hypothetical protein
MNRSLCGLSVLLLAVSLLACAALAVPAPKPSLKEWGDPINPDPDCKVRLDGGVLSIEMPGTEHEYDPARKRFNAPRILREIEGDFVLQVRIRIDCPPFAQSSVKGHPAHVSAGFLILYPDSPLFVSPPYEIACERVDYGVMQQRIGIDDFPVDSDRHPFRSLGRPQIEKESRKGIGEDGCVLVKHWGYNSTARENGGPRIGLNRFQQLWLCFFDRGWRDWPMPKKADCVYMRMEQWDEDAWDRGIRFFISPNGVKWTQLTGHTWGTHPRPKVGLAAYSTSAEPSRVRFDQIKLWRGRKKKR